jgi:hypothetical protein
MIRERTADFAADGVALLEGVVDWARRHDCARLADRLADQVEARQGEAARAVADIRDLTDTLREMVNRGLIDAIEVPIRLRCQEFCTDGRNSGPGVRGRMLQLFAELGERVADAAEGVALPLLQAGVDEQETAVREHPSLRRHPLDAIDQLAADLVSEPTEELRRRVDLGRAVSAALTRLGPPEVGR